MAAMDVAPPLSQAVMTVIGVMLIAGAQIFTATQFVLEERIMEKYSMEPIKVVGWEGIFGFLVTFIAMIILHFSVGTGYFNAKEGFYQMTHNKGIAISSFLIMISIGYVVSRSINDSANSVQWFQLLWSFRDSHRFRYLTLHY
jgi:low affinity Fe/Cu permease